MHVCLILLILRAGSILYIRCSTDCINVISPWLEYECVWSEICVCVFVCVWLKENLYLQNALTACAAFVCVYALLHGWSELAELQCAR